MTGELWKACEEESGNECAVGVAILKAEERFVYADLKTAQTGANCAGGGPPDETDPPTGSYTIVPCITGSWYLDARDGAHLECGPPFVVGHVAAVDSRYSLVYSRPQ